MLTVMGWEASCESCAGGCGSLGDTDGDGLLRSAELWLPATPIAPAALRIAVREKEESVSFLEILSTYKKVIDFENL